MQISTLIKWISYVLISNTLMKRGRKPAKKAIRDPVADVTLEQITSKCHLMFTLVDALS